MEGTFKFDLNDPNESQNFKKMVKYSSAFSSLRDFLNRMDNIEKYYPKLDQETILFLINLRQDFIKILEKNNIQYEDLF